MLVASKASVSRRGFLAGAAAATAAVSLPGSNAIGQPASSVLPPVVNDTATVFGIHLEYDDGSLQLIEMAPSQAQAEYRARYSHHKVKPVPAVFTGRSFRIIDVQWFGWRESIERLAAPSDFTGRKPFDADEMETLRGQTGLPEAAIRAEAAKYLEDPDGYTRYPQHSLDMPPAIVTWYGDESYVVPDELYSDRDEALETAARWNAEAVKRVLNFGNGDRVWGEYTNDHWYIVLELGDEPQQAATVMTVFFGDLGTQQTAMHRPVRLVRPLAAELARFAEPLTWE